jgi:pimeloyl-ACP methyl ester carboxylesterase
MTETRMGKKRTKFDFQEIQKVSNPKHALVLIHGIFSDHNTFDDMLKIWNARQFINECIIATFDYDYWDKIENNGDGLSQVLDDWSLPTGVDISLICHSKGGLVARAAIIKHGSKLLRVRKIFMMGTPNFGALRPAQLGGLLQITLASARKIYGIFPRKSGIIELTSVNKAMKEIYSVGDKSHATSIEYITVPGLFYDDERVDLREVGVEWTGAILNNILPWLPSASIKIERPHDGIVENTSVRMDCNDQLEHEKRHCLFITKFMNPRSYAHIWNDNHNCSLMHTTIQRNEAISLMIAAIIEEGSVENWWTNLSLQDQIEWQVRPVI